MGKLGAESPNNPHGVKLAIKQIDFMQKLAYMLGYQELNSIKSGGHSDLCFFRLNVKYVLSIIKFKFFLEKFKRVIGIFPGYSFLFAKCRYFKDKS